MNSNFFDFIHVFNAFYTSIGGVYTLITTNVVDIGAIPQMHYVIGVHQPQYISSTISMQ